MKGNAVTMIAIAAVFGGISIFAADWWVKSAADARVNAMSASMKTDDGPEIKFKTIVVATESLRFGTDIEASKLAVIPWPQEDLPEGAFATVEELLSQGSRVAVSPIERNEPVLLAKLSGPNGRATLSNLLAPGMRATTIEIDEIAGVGGFITPGDRVDILSVRELRPSEGGSSGSQMTSEIVLENVKVLSVGQGADVRKTTPEVTRSVTVEVDTEGAQKIAEARAVGRLSLSLRSVMDAAGKGMARDEGLAGKTARRITDEVADLIITSSNRDEEFIPRFTTVIVTRGTEEGKAYEVLTEEDEEEK